MLEEVKMMMKQLENLLLNISEQILRNAIIHK